MPPDPDALRAAGRRLGAQYRFLSAANAGSLNGNFLPNDQRMGGANRSYIGSRPLHLPVNTRVDPNMKTSAIRSISRISRRAPNPPVRRSCRAA